MYVTQLPLPGGGGKLILWSTNFISSIPIFRTSIKFLRTSRFLVLCELLEKILTLELKYDVHNLSNNSMRKVKYTMYREFHHDIVHIAKEGHHIRINKNMHLWCTKLACLHQVW